MFEPISGQSRLLMTKESLLSPLRASNQYENIKFPHRAPNGDIFYLLEMPQVMGGNACPLDTDYHFVVVRENDAWASSAFGGCVRPDRVAVDSSRPSIIVTDSSEGYTESRISRTVFEFGNEKTETTVKPVTVASSEEVIAKGFLTPGVRAISDNRPYVEGPGGNPELIIDEVGPCQLDPLFGEVVELIVDRINYSNGIEKTKCKGIKSVQ
jgi:hypothetical protein